MGDLMKPKARALLVKINSAFSQFKEEAQ